MSQLDALPGHWQIPKPNGKATTPARRALIIWVEVDVRSDVFQNSRAAVINQLAGDVDLACHKQNQAWGV